MKKQFSIREYLNENKISTGLHESNVLTDITLNESLINNPNAATKGKTIKSFKSNGRYKGYTMIFTDGTTIHISGDSQSESIYITKG